MTTLRDFRKKSGLTIEQMAAELGLSSASLSRIERGDQWPDWEIIRRVEKHSGGKVRPSDFLVVAELRSREMDASPKRKGADGNQG